MLRRPDRSPALTVSISAPAENRCDDGGYIHRSLSRISLFFCLRDQPESVGDRTPYRQQTLGSSCVPWLCPHRVLVSMGKVQASQFQQWNDCSKSLRGNARCPLEGKCCRGAFLYMLIKSLYDLIRAFVVAAFKHLVTVVTVENQHVNHPPVHRAPDPICKSPSRGEME